jgi:hypothetical protein
MRLIFEAWWEFVEDKVEMHLGKRYVVTSNATYPANTEDIGNIRIDRKLLKEEFTTKEEVLDWIISNDRTDLGMLTKEVANSYPAANLFCLSWFPAETGRFDHDGRKIFIDKLDGQCYVHVAGNQFSPFVFSSEKAAEEFMNNIS